MLAFLYGLARLRESVFEITVEDPAPGFEKVKADTVGSRSSRTRTKRQQRYRLPLDRGRQTVYSHRSVVGRCLVTSLVWMLVRHQTYVRLHSNLPRCRRDTILEKDVSIGDRNSGRFNRRKK